MRALVVLGLLGLAACSHVQPTDETVRRQSGLLVERRDMKTGAGVFLRVSGASWLFGGDAQSIYDAEAATAARNWGCVRWRIDGRRESQQGGVLGTYRVVEGTVVCLH